MAPSLYPSISTSPTGTIIIMGGSRPGAAGRGRVGGGGMLVLSRNRGAAPKVAPKLSVPPPLNLPSLRKEHEKFDTSGPGGTGATAGTGSGSRPSSGVGWNKPVASATVLVEKVENGANGVSDAAGASRVGSYMPPSARSMGVVASVSREFLPSAKKAMLLKGEDFPSLQAARPVSSGASQKHKDGLNQKQKQVSHDDSTQDKVESYHLVHIKAGGRMADQIKKQEQFLPDPLPLVRMNPRSDWADDERDTGHGWRTSLPKDGVSKIGNHRVDIGSRMAVNNMAKENKYTTPYYGGDTVQDGSNDSAFGRRAMGLVGQQMQRNSSSDSYNNRGADRNSRDHHVFGQPNRYKADIFQNNALSRPFIASTGRRPPIADPIQEKRFSNSGRPYSDDIFSRDYISSGFDERDLYSNGFVGVVKRKKDVAKSTHFHDPIRESFEAELERVQKMQELERQRIAEEQERALEQTRREDEERLRRIREEEERLRKLDEESCVAAWRAEHGGQNRSNLRQMRQELEDKIAKRQAETVRVDASVPKTTVDEKLNAAVKEDLVSMNEDLETWEDGERMVENVMNSGSFNSSVQESSLGNLGRCFPSPQSDQETGHYSPWQDAVAGGRTGSRREFHGGPGFMPSRSYGVQESYSDDFGYQNEQRWNLSGNADSYGKLREIDFDFQDIADRYGYCIHYTHASRTESGRESDYYGTNQGGPRPSEIFGRPLESNSSERQKLKIGSGVTHNLHSPFPAPQLLHHIYPRMSWMHLVLKMVIERDKDQRVRHDEYL
ncbi:hypothetical protein SASPL_115096 [Salvia splendens]|uniref:Uncharacterized protein n=1 Tax=Salvia splendens TaxID=180675 RepID=A0A8X9A1T3_SALSN|nr:hypothetical protein SASPL_115096 [Salvia splendens]